MTSLALMAIRCASSLTVIVSPISTSRTTGSVGFSNAVLRIDAHGHCAAALLLLLAAPAHAVGDVQRVIAVARLLDHPLFLGLLARALGVRTLLRLLLALRGLAALFVGALFRGFVGGGRAALLVLEPLALLGLALLGREPLALGRFALLLLLADGALDGGAGVLFGAARGVELFLLLARLLLEHVALDVGALLAHLDVDRAGAALAARELELALRFAVQRDAARRGIRGILAAVVLLAGASAARAWRPR